MRVDYRLEKFQRDFLWDVIGDDPFSKLVEICTPMNSGWSV